jgi:hypothetical protein
VDVGRFTFVNDYVGRPRRVYVDDHDHDHDHVNVYVYVSVYVYVNVYVYVSVYVYVRFYVRRLRVRKRLRQTSTSTLRAKWGIRNLPTGLADGPPNVRLSAA